MKKDDFVKNISVLQEVHESKKVQKHEKTEIFKIHQAISEANKKTQIAYFSEQVYLKKSKKIKTSDENDTFFISAAILGGY